MHGYIQKLYYITSLVQMMLLAVRDIQDGIHNPKQGSLGYHNVQARSNYLVSLVSRWFLGRF